MKKYDEMVALKHRHEYNRRKKSPKSRVDSSLPWSHSQHKDCYEGRSRPPTRACPSRMPTVRDSSRSVCSSRSMSHPEIKRHDCLSNEGREPFNSRSSSLPPRPPSRQKGSVEHTGRTPEKKKRKRKLRKPSVENALPPSILEEEATEETRTMESMNEIRFSETEDELIRPKTPRITRRPTGFPFNCIEEHKKLDYDENVKSLLTERLGDPLYLQFALHITEDIIRNDHYTSSEMKKIITSHINANRGILNEEEMLKQVYMLCKDLNISPILTKNDESETECENLEKLPLKKKCTCPFVSKYQNEILKGSESNDDSMNLDSTSDVTEQTTDDKSKFVSAENLPIDQYQTQVYSRFSILSGKSHDLELPRVERLFEVDLSSGEKIDTAIGFKSHLEQHVAEKLQVLKNVLTKPDDVECSDLKLVHISNPEMNDSVSNCAYKDLTNNENQHTCSVNLENTDDEVKEPLFINVDKNPPNSAEENVEKIIKEPATDGDKNIDNRSQAGGPGKSVSFLKKISIVSESNSQQCPCEEILNKLLNKPNFCINSCCQKLNLIEKFLLENETLITVNDSPIKSVENFISEQTSNTGNANKIPVNDDGRSFKDFYLDPETQLNSDINTFFVNSPVTDEHLFTDVKHEEPYEANNSLQSSGSTDETIKKTQDEKCSCIHCEKCICDLKIESIGDSLYSFVRMNEYDVSTQMTTKVEKRNATTMTDSSISSLDFGYEKYKFKDEAVNTFDHMFLNEIDATKIKKSRCSSTSRDIIINLPIKLHDVSTFYPSVGVQTDEKELISTFAVQSVEAPQTDSKRLMRSSLDCNFENQQLAQTFINDTCEDVSSINFAITDGLEVNNNHQKETSFLTDVLEKRVELNEPEDIRESSAIFNEQTDSKIRSSDSDERVDVRKKSVELNEQTGIRERSSESDERTDSKRKSLEDLSFVTSGFSMHKLSSLTTTATPVSSDYTYSQDLSKENSLGFVEPVNTSKTKDNFEKINDSLTKAQQDNDDKSSSASLKSFIKHLDHSPQVYLSASMEKSLKLIKTEMEHFRRGEDTTDDDRKNAGYFDNLDASEGSESVDAVSRAGSLTVSEFGENYLSPISDFSNTKENQKNVLPENAENPINASENVVPNTDSGNSKVSEKRRSIRFESSN